MLLWMGRVLDPVEEHDPQFGVDQVVGGVLSEGHPLGAFEHSQITRGPGTTLSFRVGHEIGVKVVGAIPVNKTFLHWWNVKPWNMGD